MTIADQVATLEQDHADALKQMDALQAANTALRADCAALSAENLALQSHIEDLKKHEEETLAAVETLANASLDMLRTAQRPAGMPAAIIPFAPKPKPATAAKATADDPSAQMSKADVNAAKQAIREGISDLVDADPRFKAEQPEPPTQNAGDSGDETESWPLSPEPGPAVPQINEPPANDAMSRIQPTARALPPNVLRTQYDGPQIVRHSDEGLPIFLQRDTVFQRQGGQVFA